MRTIIVRSGQLGMLCIATLWVTLLARADAAPDHYPGISFLKLEERGAYVVDNRPQHGFFVIGKQGGQSYLPGETLLMMRGNRFIGRAKVIQSGFDQSLAEASQVVRGQAVQIGDRILKEEDSYILRQAKGHTPLVLESIAVPNLQIEGVVRLCHPQDEPLGKR